MIFVNYRQSDSLSITGRIDDHLRLAFGEEDVYRDIDSIPAGVDFVEHLESSLGACDVCLAILGRSWASERLHDANDFVRLELEIALRRGIPVIPVLVERAELPRSIELPGTLAPLLRRQAMRIDSGADFRAHMKRLVQAIRASRARLAPGSGAFPTPSEIAVPAATSAPSAVRASEATDHDDSFELEFPAPPNDEWFVGIQGVPVGPISRTELETHALTGAVTLESLVWRDGLDEWRPLTTFPELVTLVRGASAGIDYAQLFGGEPPPLFSLEGLKNRGAPSSSKVDDAVIERPYVTKWHPAAVGAVVLMGMLMAAFAGYLLVR